MTAPLPIALYNRERAKQCGSLHGLTCIHSIAPRLTQTWSFLLSFRSSFVKCCHQIDFTAYLIFSASRMDSGVEEVRKRQTLYCRDPRFNFTWNISPSSIRMAWIFFILDFVAIQPLVLGRWYSREFLCKFWKKGKGECGFSAVRSQDCFGWELDTELSVGLN